MAVPEHCLSYAMLVKHGTDTKAPLIDLTRPDKSLSVVDIHNLPVPTDVPIGGWYRARIEDRFENRYHLVRGIFQGPYSQEEDGDRKYRLAGTIRGDVTVRCEIPSPECCVGSPWIAHIAKAYDAVAHMMTGDLVEVGAIGFWDLYHYKPGGSFDPHELHPVLSIRRIA